MTKRVKRRTKWEQNREKMAMYEAFNAALEHESMQAAAWMGYLVLELNARIPRLSMNGALELACALVLRLNNEEVQDE